METTLAVLGWLQTLLSTCVDLQAVTGLTQCELAGNIHHLMAGKNSTFPYLVHVIRDSEWPIGSKDYSLDIWTSSPKGSATTEAQALEIKTILKKLFINSRVTTDGGEVVDGRVLWVYGNFVTTDSEFVSHYETVWNLRYFAKQEVEDVT